DIKAYDPTDNGKLFILDICSLLTQWDLDTLQYKKQYQLEWDRIWIAYELKKDLYVFNNSFTLLADFTEIRDPYCLNHVKTVSNICKKFLAKLNGKFNAQKADLYMIKNERIYSDYNEIGSLLSKSQIVEFLQVILDENINTEDDKFIIKKVEESYEGFLMDEKREIQPEHLQKYRFVYRCELLGNKDLVMITVIGLLIWMVWSKKEIKLRYYKGFSFTSSYLNKKDFNDQYISEICDHRENLLSPPDFDAIMLYYEELCMNKRYPFKELIDDYIENKITLILYGQQLLRSFLNNKNYLIAEKLPTIDISLKYPSYSNDPNDSWNLVSAYNSISENSSISENTILVEPPTATTNMFTMLKTAILAIYNVDGVIKTIEDKKEIVRTAIFLSDDTEDTENLNAPGVVLIAEETYRKIINDLADMKEKDSVATEDDLDSDNLSQVNELMFDAQANKDDILNLEEGQHTEDSHINDYFKTSKRMKNNNASKYPHVNENQEQRDNNFEETDKLLPYSHLSINVTVVNNEFESNEEIDNLLPDSHSSINVTANTSQAVSTDNQISIDNECVTDNQQAENNGELVESIFNDEEVDELLPDSHSPINVTVNTLQAVSIDNQISPNNEYESILNNYPNDQLNDQPSINVISGMLEQTTLAENSTLADDIESIQDNDY
ncbi:17198_t:CDS:10, partial [Racocetra persica]